MGTFWDAVESGTTVTGVTVMFDGWSQSLLVANVSLTFLFSDNRTVKNRNIHGTSAAWYSLLRR